MKRCRSLAEGFRPVSIDCQDIGLSGFAGSRLASTASLMPLSAVSSEPRSASPRFTPSSASDSVSARPRRLGSAAMLPMKGCALIMESARFCTSSTGSSMSPFLSKNGPPSGRLTLVKSLDVLSFAVSVAVAVSACSGVDPLTTTAIRSEFWGNSLSNLISRWRQTSFSDSRRSVSVSILRRLIATQPKAEPANAASTSTSQAWRLHQATTAAVRSPIGRRSSWLWGSGGFDTEPYIPSRQMSVDGQDLPAQAVLTGGKTGQLRGDDVGRAVRRDRQWGSLPVRSEHGQARPFVIDPAVEMQGHVRIGGDDRVDGGNRIDNDRMCGGGPGGEHR